MELTESEINALLYCVGWTINRGERKAHGVDLGELKRKLKELKGHEVSVDVKR